MTAVLLLVALALLAGSALVALRAPFLALAVYAAVVPFGSSVPLPAPPPVDDVSSVLGALVMVGLALRLATSMTLPLPFRTTTALWTLLLGSAALTTLWSRDAAATLLGVVVLLSLVALYALVAATPVSASDVRAFEIGLVVGGALVGAYAAYLGATGALAFAVDQRFVAAPGGSETGPTADPNITAASLLLPFFVALALAFRPGPLALRSAALASAALMVVGVFLTGSRGGLLALIAGLAVLIALSARPARTAAVLLVPALGVALAVSVAPSEVTERVSSDSRSSGRSDIWRIGVLSCPQYCLQGSGWSTFPLVHEDRWLHDPAARGVQQRFEAHNIWLSTLVEGGVLALVLLTAGLVATGRGLTRVPRSLRGPPLAALTALLVSNVFLSTVSFKYFWLVLIYAVLIQNLAEHRAPTPTDPTPAPARREGART